MTEKTKKSIPLWGKLLITVNIVLLIVGVVILNIRFNNYEQDLKVISLMDMQQNKVVETNSVVQALDIMDSRYSNFQSELALYITLFSVIITGISIGIPIFNNNQNKDQIDNLIKSVDEKLTKKEKELDEKINKKLEVVDEKLKEQEKSIEIQTKVTLANQQEYDEGITILEELTEKYKKDPKTYYYKYRYNLKNKKFNEAEYDLEKYKVIEELVDNQDKDLHYLFEYARFNAMKGIYCKNQEYLIKAIELCERRLSINNKHSSTILICAVSYNNLKKSAKTKENKIYYCENALKYFKSKYISDKDIKYKTKMITKLTKELEALKNQDENYEQQKDLNKQEEKAENIGQEPETTKHEVEEDSETKQP